MLVSVFQTKADYTILSVSQKHRSLEKLSSFPLYPENLANISYVLIIIRKNTLFFKTSQKCQIFAL